MFLDLPDLRLWYEREGKGEPPLVVIHGVGNSSDDWLSVIDFLADAFDIIRIDMRGHGRSSIPPGEWTIGDLSEDIVALADHLELERMHVAGFSLGGLVAQYIAIQHPARLKRLAILSSVSGRSEQERAAVEARLSYIVDSHPADYFERSVDRWFTPGFRASNPEAVEKKKRIISAMDREAYAKAYRILATTDLAEDLHRIEAPTLVMTGEHDRGSNTRMAKLMHEKIPESELVILPDLRHSILLEAPALVAGHLRKWFGG